MTGSVARYNSGFNLQIDRLLTAVGFFGRLWISPPNSNAPAKIATCASITLLERCSGHKVITPTGECTTRKFDEPNRK